MGEDFLNLSLYDNVIFLTQLFVSNSDNSAQFQPSISIRECRYQTSSEIWALN